MRMMHFLVGDKLTQYQVKSIRPFNRAYDGLVLADENDLAVVTLEKPVVGVEPLALRALGAGDDGRELGPVTLVAYAGLTKKVQDCSFRERAGTYPSSPDVLIHDCDSEGNASGAPFLDASGALVAIHLGGSSRGVTGSWSGARQEIPSQTSAITAPSRTSSRGRLPSQRARESRLRSPSSTSTTSSSPTTATDIGEGTTCWSRSRAC